MRFCAPCFTSGGDGQPVYLLKHVVPLVAKQDWILLPIPSDVSCLGRSSVEEAAY